MKDNHPLAFSYISRLLRHTTMANGPLYKWNERNKFKRELRGKDQSIYPWLSRDAVAEFQSLIA